MAFTLVPVSAYAAFSRTDDRVAHATSVRPASAPPAPTTGHLHLLASPTRVASSLTGLLLPGHAVAGNASPLLHLAGVGGLPATGILAVAIVITTSSPTGSTSIRLGSASATPVLMTTGGTTSAFAIAPVAAGSIRVRNGAHATQLTVDAVGWFSSAPNPGTAGLFRTLAGRTIPVATIAAGAKRVVSILGEEDVPSSGVSAVMLRLQVTATGSGALAVGPSAASVGGYVTEAYRSGTGSDLGIVAVGPSGSIAIKNSGSSSVTVSLDALGWFTDGTAASAYGDGLSLATPFKALDAEHVATSGTSPKVCAKSGIPAETSSRPPSLVLARGLATSASAAMGLRADAQGATPSGATALVIRKATSLAGQLLLAPGTACGTTISTTNGTTTVTVEPYAWFSGGVIISDRARVLTGSALSAITSVTGTKVTFTGTAASLPDLHVGDVIGAGISVKTPDGLLRTVTAIARTGNTLVVTTKAAKLGDAVLQGSLSVGQSEKAPTPAAPAAAPRRPSSLASPSSAPSCGVNGSPMRLGMTVSCDASLGGGGIWSANIYASAGVAMTFGADIHWGLPPTVHVHTTLGVSAATGATVTATAEHPIDETVPMPSRRLAPIDVQIGGWPVVIVPELSASLHATGHLQATFSATASMHAAASVTFDSDTGFAPTNSFGGDGDASYNASLNANVKVTFDPTVKALLYGLDASYISAGLSPYVEVTANSCTIRAHAGLDVTFGFSLGFTKAVSVSHDFTLPVADTELFTIAWRNCAVWSGTLTFRENDHYKDNVGRPTDDANWSDNITISAPTDGAPPSDGLYSATGSGSGAMNLYQYSCDPDPAPPNLELPWTWAYTWGGDMDASFTPYFETSDGFAVLNGPSLGQIIGGGTLSSACAPPEPVSWTHQLYTSSFFALVDPVDAIFKFATPSGQSDFIGSFHLDTPQDNGGSTHIEFSYAFHRTCTQGGTDC